jgi:hypothetical protein
MLQLYRRLMERVWAVHPELRLRGACRLAAACAVALGPEAMQARGGAG